MTTSPSDIPNSIGEYRKWANENPSCCEYCLDQWLSDQAESADE